MNERQEKIIEADRLFNEDVEQIGEWDIPSINFILPKETPENRIIKKKGIALGKWEINKEAIQNGEPITGLVFKTTTIKKD